MKTQGEIEAAICERISRFEQEYMARGPKDVHAYLIGDLLVVRLTQVRTQLIETARSVMEAMVQEVTGVKVLSLHQDISTITGEEVVLFTLAESSLFRGTKKNRTCDPRAAPIAFTSSAACRSSDPSRAAP